MKTIVLTESTTVVQTCGTSEQIFNNGEVWKSAKNFTNIPGRESDESVFKVLVVVTKVQNQYEDLYGLETMSNEMKKILRLIGTAKYLLLMLRIKGEKVKVKESEDPKVKQSQETKQEVNNKHSRSPLNDQSEPKQKQDQTSNRKLKNQSQIIPEEKDSEEKRGSLVEKDTNRSKLTGSKIRQSQRIKQKKEGVKKKDKFELLTRKKKVSIKIIKNNKKQEKQAQANGRKLKNQTQIIKERRKREEKLSRSTEEKENIQKTNESELIGFKERRSKKIKQNNVSIKKTDKFELLTKKQAASTESINSNKKRSKKKIAVTAGQFGRRHLQVISSLQSRKKSS